MSEESNGIVSSTTIEDPVLLLASSSHTAVECSVVPEPHSPRPTGEHQPSSASGGRRGRRGRRKRLLSADQNMDSSTGDAPTVPEAEAESSSHINSADAGKKRRRRRRKKRPYKPYMKMSWDERRALEVKEEQRAEHTRAERFAHGVPVAPYNTTQFLLQDRQARTERQKEDVDEIVNHMVERRRRHSRSESYGSSETESGSSSEEEYLERQRDEFSQDFATLHAERMEGMSKQQLIDEYLNMEQKLEQCQAELADARRELQVEREARLSHEVTAAAKGAHD